MGGICGFFNTAQSDCNTLQHMAEAMAVRGPDATVLKQIGPQTGMAYLQLAPAKKPPYAGALLSCSEDDTVFLAADADIINLEELNVSIPAATSTAHLVQSPAVLLGRLYRHYGLDFVTRIRGVFAIAIIDLENDSLFLIKDRLGVKPLYYSKRGTGILFASGIKAILASGLVPRAVHPAAIHDYLTYQYVPSPQTAFRGINKVPPASIFQFKGNSILAKKYWSLAFQPKSAVRYSDSVKQLREMVTETSKRMLRDTSDIGVLLSGGIDSTIMTGLLSQLTGRQLPVFSIGFEEDVCNELPFARATAERFGATFNELIVTPDMVDVLPDIVRAYEEPYADSSALPTYLVARLAGKQVKTVFLGDGGNDSFAGYMRYWAMVTACRFDIIPNPLLRGLARLFLALTPRTTRLRSTLGYGRRFMELLQLPPADRYGQLMCHFTNPMKARLYADPFWDQVGTINSFDFIKRVYAEPARDNELLDRLLYTDMNSYMPGDLVVKVEVAAAHNRIVARAPLLDHTILEFAARLPIACKLQGKRGKRILKDTFADFLTDDIVQRRKTGFGAPIGTWFKNELNGYLKEHLLGHGLARREYFKPEALAAMIQEHESGYYNHGYPLWNLLLLELWHREFIDASS